MSKPRLYLSGPMRGARRNKLDPFNRAAFETMEDEARSLGWSPYNPCGVPLDYLRSLSPLEEEREVQREVSRIENGEFDALWLMQGFEISEGCRREIDAALKRGIPIMPPIHIKSPDYLGLVNSSEPTTLEAKEPTPPSQRTFPSGSVRDRADGKGRYDLLQFAAIRRVALILELGGKRYGDRNWELGQPMSAFLDSAARHLAKWAEGWVDEDHLGAAAWNLLSALEMEERDRQDLADLPWQEDAEIVFPFRIGR